MIAATSARSAGQRGLSAGTTQRFVLLLVLFLVSSVQLAGVLLWDRNFPGVQAVSFGDNGCLLAAGVNPSATGIALMAPTIHAWPALSACIARYGWNPPWWPPYAITAGLVAIAGLIYLMLAARRRSVVPVADVDPGGELAGALGELTATAGLSLTLDRFVIDPTATTANAVAFGLPRRHTVCLHGPLMAQFRSDPEGFRTVVLHELAHIKNRDVGLTYATIAAWRGYLIALLLPAAVSSTWLLLAHWAFGMGAQSVFWPSTRASELESLAVTACIVLLVYLARADVMRARETYADLDAATWGARAAPIAGERKRPGPLAAFWQLWQTHPGRRQQAEVLTDVSAVSRVSSLQMFLTGMAAMVILYQFQGDLAPGGGYQFQGGLSSGRGIVGGSQYWPGILAAALVTSVVGVALWRAVANAALTGDHAPTGLRAGLWVGAGLMAGDLLEGIASVYGWRPVEPAYLLALLLFATVATGWSAQFAALCFDGWHGRGRAIVMVAGLAVIWVWVAVWLIWWYSDGRLYAFGLPLTSDALVRNLLRMVPGPAIPGHHAVLLAIGAVIGLEIGQAWLLAVAAALLWVASLLTWVHRTPVGSPRLRSVLLAGLGGGAVCWAGAIAVMAYLHSWRIPADQRFGSYLLIFFGCLAACVAAGMAAAAAAAALVRGSRVHAALVAAGTASLAGLAGAYLLVSGDGCVAPLDTMVNSCAWRPLGGVFVHTFGAFALATGSVAAAAVTLLVLAAERGRARPVSVTPDRVMPAVQAWSGLGAWPGSLLAKRTAIAALTVAAVTVLAVTISLPGGSAGGQQSLPNQTPATTYSASPQATGVMVAAWLHYGGLQRIKVLYVGFAGLSDAVDQSYAALAREDIRQGPKAKAEFRATAAPTASACAAILHAAQSAETYFQVPSPTLQLQWQSTLTGFAVGAGSCLKSVSKVSPAQLLASLKSILRAYKPLGPLLIKLNFIARHFCRACL